MNTVSPPAATEKPWRNIRFDVLDKMNNLPSLNSVVLEFLELSQREYFTARDFETVISKDQALVARVMKLANSGLYGRPRSISSIPEAVVLVGLDNLKKVVFAVSTGGLIRHSLTNYAYDPDRGFWRHSLGVGLTSRVLVEASPKWPLRSEEAYVAGLLHDIGQLVIDEFLPPMEGRRVGRKDEIEAVGLDHAELGEYILSQWNLPETITACVRHHHDYLEAGKWSQGAAVLNLAEGICGHWGLGRKREIDLSEDLPWEKFQVAAHFIGLPEENWNQVIWDIRQNLVGLDGIFQDYPE